MKIKYFKFKYQLAETVIVHTSIRPKEAIDLKFLSMDKNGVLIIKDGYGWDGSTGSIDTNTNLPGSLVHDALCELINKGYLNRMYQILADQLFREILEQDGMNPIRVKLHFMAVRKYDKSGLKKYKPKQALEAP